MFTWNSGLRPIVNEHLTSISNAWTQLAEIQSNKNRSISNSFKWWEKSVNEGYGLKKFTNIKGRGPWL